MVLYDREERRIIVDIGVIGAEPGNGLRYLEQMTQAFRTQWRAGADLRVGGHAREVEWLQIEGGLVFGVPARCRAFLMPSVSDPVTDYLLRRCDALVFACRATVPGLAAATRPFSRVCQAAEDAGAIPLIVALLGADTGRSGLVDDGGLMTAPVLAIDCGSGLDGPRETMRAALECAVEEAPPDVLEAARRDFR